MILNKANLNDPLKCSTNDECLLKWLELNNKEGLIKPTDIIYINKDIFGKTVKGIEYYQGRSYIKEFVFPEKGNIWSIGFSINVDREAGSAYLEEFDQILSTFKFTDTDQE